MTVKPLYKEIGFPVRTIDARGKKVELTAELLTEAVKHTREQILKGFRVLCYDGHFTNKNEDIKGRWIDIQLINNVVYGVVLPNSEEDRKYIKSLDTSMIIAANVQINEDTIPVMITRIDVVGQGAIAYTAGFKEPEEFQLSNQLAALGNSAKGAEFIYLSFFNREEPSMLLAKFFARMFGLPETATEEEVFKAMQQKASATEGDNDMVYAKMKRYFMHEDEPKEEPKAELMKPEETELEAKHDNGKEMAAMGRQSIVFMMSRLPESKREVLLGNYDELVAGGLKPSSAMKFVSERVRDLENAQESEKSQKANDPAKTLAALSQFNSGELTKLERPEPQKDLVQQGIDEGVAFWDSHCKSDN